MSKLVSYLRVSSAKQERSGLSIEAQRKAVQDFANATAARIVAEFVETESGKNNDRPELAKAIGRTRAVRGKLVVATLDRLSRKVALVANLMESGVQFSCCDAPNASPFELHIRASMAEEERRKISERTRLALAAAKRRGILLGAHRPGIRAILKSERVSQHLRRIRPRSVVARRTYSAQRRSECYDFLMDQIQTMRQAGSTLQAICDVLNTEGHTTVGGGQFFPNTIRRLLLNGVGPWQPGDPLQPRM